MLRQLCALISHDLDTPTPNSRRQQRKPRRFRLGMETLEDRCVPATIAVNTTLDVVNPSDGKTSLREAITQANSTAEADTIMLQAGVYKIEILGTTENANARGDFDITNPVTIAGLSSASTIIDAGQRDRVFDVIGTFDAKFSKVTIRNGFTDNPVNGGGIHALNADLFIVNSVVSGNQGLNGGGIYAENGSVQLNKTKVLNNRAFDLRGGGINAVNGPVTLFDSVVNGNTAAHGAGINAQNGLVHVERSTVNRNMASGDGGGLHVGNNAVTLIDSTVRRNVAGQPGDDVGGGFGGGLFAKSATVNTSNVSDNFAFVRGGGLYTSQSATLNGSTVNGNTARDEGGGMYIFATATLTNTTVNNNQALSADGFGGGVVTTNAFLTGSTVNGNRAGNGAGVGATFVSLNTTTVSNNLATDRGAGVYSITTASVISSTISGNTAGGAGGGLFATTANVTNSTLSGNTAGASGLGGGGGIRAETGVILNSTIVENFAAGGGGGILGVPGNSTIRIKNTIIADNFVLAVSAGPDVLGTFTSDGNNLIGKIEGSSGFGSAGDQSGTFSNPLDPLLGPLADNGGRTFTHHLQKGSPAIDRGSNTGAPSSDQRGVSRPRDGDFNTSSIVDVGAVER